MFGVKRFDTLESIHFCNCNSLIWQLPAIHSYDPQNTSRLFQTLWRQCIHISGGQSAARYWLSAGTVHRRTDPDSTGELFKPAAPMMEEFSIWSSDMINSKFCLCNRPRWNTVVIFMRKTRPKWILLRQRKYRSVLTSGNRGFEEQVPKSGRRKLRGEVGQHLREDDHTGCEMLNNMNNSNHNCDQIGRRGGTEQERRRSASQLQICSDCQRTGYTAHGEQRVEEKIPIQELIQFWWISGGRAGGKELQAGRPWEARHWRMED